MLCKLERKKGTASPYCLFWTEYAHLTQSAEWIKYIKPTVHQSPSFLSTALHLCLANNRGNSCFDPTIILKSRGAHSLVKTHTHTQMRCPLQPVHQSHLCVSFFRHCLYKNCHGYVIEITFACFFFLSHTPLTLHYYCEATLGNRSWKYHQFWLWLAPTGEGERQQETIAGGASGSEWRPPCLCDSP